MTMVIYVLALAILWTMIVGKISLEVFAIGLILGAALIVLLRPAAFPINPRRIHVQTGALIVYILMLFRDIVLSGVDVARRVLSPDMRLKPGVIAVSTQDEERSTITLALSADYITLTPGELVVEVKDNHLMYVHCLDVEASAATADQMQARRLKLLRQILGREK